MDATALFERLIVGEKLTLPNRLVMAPMTTTAGRPDGSFSQQEIEYLKRRGEGGIGLVMTPACYVHKSGHAFDHQVGCHTDEMLHGLTECARAINETGAASFLQIHHGGNAAKEAYTGEPPWAPSAVHNRRGTSEEPVAMTEEQIQEVIGAFASGAKRARQAGFTGIELHGANTYLLQQFFSPYTNKRSDRWGVATWENRTRFAIEVTRAVRETVGPDYPMAYRISPEEPDPDGYSTYDAIRLLQDLVDAGIDIVHVSSWQYGEGVRYDYPPDSHPTRLIREALPPSVPVIGVGGISTPEDAMRVLNDGVELIALGRALLLDAHWARKVRENRSEEIISTVKSREQLNALDLPDRMKDYTARFFLE